MRAFIETVDGTVKQLQAVHGSLPWLVGLFLLAILPLATSPGLEAGLGDVASGIRDESRVAHKSGRVAARDRGEIRDADRVQRVRSINGKIRVRGNRRRDAASTAAAATSGKKRTQGNGEQEVKFHGSKLSIDGFLPSRN